MENIGGKETNEEVDELVEQACNELLFGASLISSVRPDEKILDSHDTENEVIDWREFMTGSMAGPIGRRIRKEQDYQDPSRQRTSEQRPQLFVSKTPQLGPHAHEELAASSILADKIWQEFVMGPFGAPVGKVLGRERKEDLLRKLRDKHREEDEMVPHLMQWHR